jgi:hypothetical protein
MEQIHKIWIWHDFLFFMFFMHGALCWTHVVAKHMLSIVTLYIYIERRYLSHRVMDLLVHHLDPSDRQIDRVRRVPHSPSRVTPPPPRARPSHATWPCAPRAATIEPPAASRSWARDWVTTRSPHSAILAEQWKMADKISSGRKLLSSGKWLTWARAVGNGWTL